MNLSALKEKLNNLDSIEFELENGTKIEPHFHITEVGLITKNFIDCGGTVREEKTINFQLWHAEDTIHRLKASKLLGIIATSEKVIDLGNHEIEVEYQNETIGKYDLKFENNKFILLSKNTNCLAQDKCGIPESQLKPRVKLADLQAAQNSGACCAPGSKCC